MQTSLRQTVGLWDPTTNGDETRLPQEACILTSEKYLTFQAARRLHEGEEFLASNVSILDGIYILLDELSVPHQAEILCATIRRGG